MAENSASTQRKRHRRVAAYVGVGALLVIVLYFVPSLFLRSYVEGYLLENGMEAEGLDEIDFNVFNLGLETGPLTILRQGNVIADLDGLTLFLDLAPLVRQRIDVTGARLDGLNITLQQDDTGEIGVKDLPNFGSADDGSEPLTWLFGLTSLELANATINLELDQISGPLVIDSFHIQNLKTWTPETPGSLDLKARFYDGSIVGLLRVRPFTDVLDLDFDLEVENFPLDRTKFGVPIAGKADLATLRMPAHEQALADAQAAAAPFLAAPQDDAGTEPREIVALGALEAIDPMAEALSETENETLLALAQDRQATVRGTLVDKYGVENDSIFDCRSKDPSKTTPR